MFKKIALVASIATVIAAGWSYFSVISSEIGLMDLHPEIDQHDIIKAHRIMLVRTLTGQYNHLDTNDDEVLDRIFMEVVSELTK
jgi:predicted HAD superfamily hydrolase